MKCQLSTAKLGISPTRLWASPGIYPARDWQNGSKSQSVHVAKVISDAEQKTQAGSYLNIFNMYSLAIKHGNGKSTINEGFHVEMIYKWWLFIAMFDYQRVYRGYGSRH